MDEYKEKFTEFCDLYNGNKFKKLFICLCNNILIILEMNAKIPNKIEMLKSSGNLKFSDDKSNKYWK